MEVVLWRHTHMPLYTRIAETEKNKKKNKQTAWMRWGTTRNQNW